MSQLSRRNFLKGVSAAAGATMLSQLAQFAAQAQDSYTGKFSILSLAQADQRQFIIDAIQSAYPGVEVEWRNLPSERFTELFAASEAAGDQIDILHLNGQDLRRYAVGGKLTDLSGLDYLDRFRPVGLETYTIGDKLWGLPMGGISGFTFLYNKKSLEAVGATEEPVTYDDLKALATELKAAGIAPFSHAGKNIYLWPVWYFWAYAQTTGNQAIEKTYATLRGDIKFTEPESVAALEVLYRFAQDGMFIDGVNALDSDGAWLAFSQGQAGFYYDHTWHIGQYREGDFPQLDLSLIPPVRIVDDETVARQMPGGTGDPVCIYANIAPERQAVAQGILNVFTSDDVVKQSNVLNGDPVSTNVNVQASDDPIAIRYAEECAPNQNTYLDWFWPPEITRAFQENQQALVAGVMTPDVAAQNIQDVLDELYFDGYEFES